MKKRYIISLEHGLASFIVLIALVNLIDFANWQLLLNYFLISNFFLFFPYNRELAFREQKKYYGENDNEDSHQRRTPSRREDDEMLAYTMEVDADKRSKNQSDALTALVTGFARNCLMIVIAPLVFLYTYLMSD